jgi:hypothetical protein
MAKSIKVISTDKSLSALGDLLLAKEALDSSSLRFLITDGMMAAKNYFVSFALEPRK